MLMVIDSSMLRSERLHSFLSASRYNIAVLTDYAAMEAYKDGSPTAIVRSMEVLAKRPKQVVVLKGTQTVCGLRGRRAGLRRRLVDRNQTRGFSEFCRDLRRAENGDPKVLTQIAAHARAAREHMRRLLVDAEDWPEIFDLISKSYGGNELVALRSGFKFSDAMIERLMRHVIQISGKLFADHPRVTVPPKKEEVFNTFIFRLSLCAYVLALMRISFGGAKQVSPEKLRNDMVDINFAAYSTFYDGLMTDDKRLREIAEYVALLMPSLR
jgi:hypothetical protein